MGDDLGKVYKAVYRGLIESIRIQRGPVPSVFYARDMSVLSMILMGVYNLNDVPYLMKRPRRLVIVNEATAYTAGINTVFTYYFNKYFTQKRPTIRLRRAANSAFMYNLRKADDISILMEKMSMLRRSFTADPDISASYLGKLISGVVAWKEDEFEKDLSDAGYYFGKFMFYCMSYSSVGRDFKRDEYNPLLHMKYNDPEVFDAYIVSTIQSLFDEIKASFDKVADGRNMQLLKTVLYNRMNEILEDIKILAAKNKKR